jgi:hypothetical protein
VEEIVLKLYFYLCNDSTFEETDNETVVLDSGKAFLLPCIHFQLIRFRVENFWNSTWMSFNLSRFALSTLKKWMGCSGAFAILNSDKVHACHYQRTDGYIFPQRHRILLTSHELPR